MSYKSIPRFFNQKKINKIFAILGLIVTISSFYFEGERVEKKELELINFKLKEHTKEVPTPSSGYSELDRIYSNFEPNPDNKYILVYTWDEDDDNYLINEWVLFNQTVNRIGYSNIDKEEYNDVMHWFDKLVSIRNYCIPLYIQNEKESGVFIDAIEYGFLKGFLTNFMFYNIKERERTLQVFGPGLVNDFYCYSMDNKIINVFTSLFFSLGLLIPWYLIALTASNKRKSS